MINELTILFAIIGLIGIILLGLGYYKGWFKKEEQSQN